MVITALLLSFSTRVYADHHSRILDAVNNPNRPPADVERDQSRKPAEVLQFVGLTEGMKVLDIFAGSGYYSEIVSYIVGDKGEVVLYNNAPWVEYLKSIGDDKRLEEGRLKNVKPLTMDANALALDSERFDLALFVLGFHDLFYVDKSWPAIDSHKFLRGINHSLKTGGLFVVVDHVAVSGAAPETATTLHRIDPALIKSSSKAAGFELVKQSNLLENPKDTHLLPMGDPSVRGKTDRVLMVFRKL